jgi:hypothetical protein
MKKLIILLYLTINNQYTSDEYNKHDDNNKYDIEKTLESKYKDRCNQKNIIFKNLDPICVTLIKKEKKLKLKKEKELKLKNEAENIIDILFQKKKEVGYNCEHPQLLNAENTTCEKCLSHGKEYLNIRYELSKRFNAISKELIANHEFPFNEYFDNYKKKFSKKN